MKTFIFSTASYFITLNFTQEVNSIFANACRTKKIKYFSSNNINETIEALTKIKHLISIVINLKGMSKEEITSTLEILNKYKLKIKLTYPANDNSISPLLKIIQQFEHTDKGVTSIINQCLVQELPEGYNQICHDSLALICKTLIPDSQLQISKTELIKPRDLADYKYIVLCDSSCENGIVTSKTFFNAKAFQECNEINGTKNDSLCIDAAKEYVNQYMGLISRALRSSDEFDLKLTVPSVVVNSDSLNIRKGFFIPQQSFSDDKGVFYIEIGFINFTYVPQNFNTYTVDIEDDDIDFL